MNTVVTNVGTAASGGFTVEYFLRANPNVAAGERSLGVSATRPAIAAGAAAQTWSQTLLIPAAAPGAAVDRRRPHPARPDLRGVRR